MNIPRSARAQMAEATVTIINSGQYNAPSGKRVHIAREIAECNAQTRLFTPDYAAKFSPQNYQTVLEVQDETTLQGASRLLALGKFAKVGVLNFASAKNAGGGFLGGSQAQEESLARSSALYGSLQQCPEYYHYHRNVDHSLLYSDHVIYSPRCMVFRNDQGTLLEQPYAVDFTTSPAPNKNALARNEAHNLKRIPNTLSRRIEHFLSIAAEQGCDALVLGAWGCGVFGNDPNEVAAAFAEHLQKSGRFTQQFKQVSFSIPFNPKTPDNSKAFRRYFM
ncbi:MAG: TIGR02452 family protein [Thiotrichaceae bacterium]